MKNKYYFLFILLISVFSSCVNDFLDVKPVSDLASETYWKSADDAKTGLNAVYAQIASNYGSSSNLEFSTWFECRAADTWHVQRQVINALNVNTNKLHSGLPVTSWNGFYKAIGRVNYALFYINQMTGLSNESKNHYVAEASFLRAKMYFDMVRIWGDVPLVLEPTLNPDLTKMYVKRIPKAEIMVQILLDLDVAIKKANPTIVDTYKFTIGAAYALQTQIAMWNHEYQGAFDATTNLLKLNRYSLQTIDNWTNIFNLGNTTENIWTIKWLFANNGNNKCMDDFGRAMSSLSLNKQFIQEWKKTPLDKRAYLSYDTARTINWQTHLIENDYGFGAWKWYGPKSPGRAEAKNEQPFIIFRLADIYLLRAEAANKLNNQAEALKYLNLVRSRAGLPGKVAADYSSAPNPQLALEDLILWERKVELLGEGHRWMDLVRTGRAASSNNDVYLNYYQLWGLETYNLFTGNECELLFPVNADVIIESKDNIEQSPCY